MSLASLTSTSQGATPWLRWIPLKGEERTLASVINKKDFELAEWLVTDIRIENDNLRVIINSGNFNLVQTTFEKGHVSLGETMDSMLDTRFKEKELKEISNPQIREYLINRRTKYRDNYWLEKGIKVDESMEDASSITNSYEPGKNSVNETSTTQNSTTCASTSAVASSIIESTTSNSLSHEALHLTNSAPSLNVSATESATTDQSSTDTQTLQQLREENEKLKKELKIEKTKNSTQRKYLLITVCVGVVATIVGLANSLFFRR
jgi:hypothetical protein